MARISQYDQDSTLNKLDKVVGTDSATGATKNYTINSLVGLINDENLVSAFDGVIYTFQSYVDPAGEVKGVLNLNASDAATTTFSTVGTIYLSVLDFKGDSVEEYLEYVGSDNPKFLKISKFGDVNTFGIFEITAMVDYGSNKYKKLTVVARGANGSLTPNDRYFVANYSAQYDQNFDDDSITEFGDVNNNFFTGTGITELTNAGSGAIITSAERTKLSTALIEADVVDVLTDTATDAPLSANQGKVLKELIDDINTLLTSDNVNLDTLQEVVDFIEANKDSLDNLTIGNIAGLQAALDAKQNTEVGKGLSENDFTTILKNKLDGIAAGAEVNVNADWTAVSGDAFIENKPTGILTNTSTDSSIALSVTALTDVTSAGSGAIITGAERTKLTNLSLVGTAGKIAYFSDTDSVVSDDNLHWDASNDRLGIGTSSPIGLLELYKGDSGQTSVVAGGDNLVLNDSANGGMTILTPSTAIGSIFFGDEADNDVGYLRYDHSSNEMWFGVSGSRPITINSSGNVGIGEADPGGYWTQARQLVLSGTNNGLTIKSATAGNGRIVFTNTKSTTAGLSDGGMISYSHQNNAMIFNSNGSEAMRIDSSGNVGVGIASPNASGSRKTLHIEDSDGAAIRLADDGVSSLIRYDNTNGLSIGTVGSKNVVLSTSDTERMRIDSSGNVGIAETTPTQKLHVSGNARVTGAIYDSTNSAGGSGQVLMSTGSGTNWSNVASMSTLRLRSAAGQSADAITDIAIQWDTQEIAPDSNFVHSTSTNNSRIQVVNSGKYLVTGYLNYTGTTSNYRLATRISIRVNGATILSDFFDGTYIRGNTGIEDHGGSFSLVVDLSANDYIEVLSKRTSSASGNGTIADGTNISLVRLAGVKGEKGDTGGVSIANYGDNRLVTSGATESAINGESNLTFDGSTLALTGDQTISGDLTVSGNLIGATATSGFSVTGDLTIDTDTLFVDSANDRVGIGTTSPDAKLQVDGGANPFVLDMGAYGGLADGGIDVTATAGGDGNYGGAISFGNSSDGGRAAIAAVQSGTDPDRTSLAFIVHPNNTAGTTAEEAYRIHTASGSIKHGFGTTDPEKYFTVAGGELSVDRLGASDNAKMSLRSDDDRYSQIYFDSPSTADGIIRYYNDDREFAFLHDGKKRAWLKVTSTTNINQAEFVIQKNNNNSTSFVLQNSHTGRTSDDIHEILFRGYNDGSVSGTQSLEDYSKVRGRDRSKVEDSEVGEVEFAVRRFGTGGHQAAFRIQGSKDNVGGVKAYNNFRDNVVIKKDGGDPERALATYASSHAMLSVIDNTQVSDDSPSVVFENTNGSGNGNPTVRLWKNSNSPAVNDNLGALQFAANNDAGDLVKYGNITGTITNITDGAETGYLSINVQAGGEQYPGEKVKFYSDQMQLQSGVKLNIANIPTSATGLSSGDIYSDGGTLKIVT